MYLEAQPGAGLSFARATGRSTEFRATCRGGRQRGAFWTAPLIFLAALAAGPAFAGETTTTLEASQATSGFSESVTLTATVAGALPTGTVRFKSGARVIGTASFGGGSEAFTAISTRSQHVCALVEDGSVQCWGDNRNGRLGDGTTTDRPVPTPVTGLAGSATAVATGNEHTCALIEGGTVQCWGGNSQGQLGIGNLTSQKTPVSLTGLGGTVTAISAGFNHTCALIEGGTVQCWGGNSQGQLGIGNLTSQKTPVSVTGLGGTVTAISAGSLYSCAVIEGGAVKCWGNNTNGELGNGNTADQKTPVSVSGLGGAATAVSAGSSHTCVLIEGGSPQCWGDNFVGALGDGTSKDSKTPVTVLGLDDVTVTAVSAAGDYTCAAIEDGTIRCWGEGFVGQLGNGIEGSSTPPISVIGLGGPAAAVTTAAYTACTLLASGSAMCWGSNHRGELGNGTIDEPERSLVPVDVLGPSGERRASLAIRTLAAGNHAITAEYLGDAGYDASTSDPLAHTVSKAGTVTTVRTKPKKPKANQRVRVIATVAALAPASATPDGRMLVKLGGKKIGNVKVKNGVAKFRLPRLSKGRPKLTVRYAGTGNFAASTGKATVKIENRK